MGLPSGLGSADILADATSALPVALARVFNDAGAAGTTGLAQESRCRPTTRCSRATPARCSRPPTSQKFRLNIGVRTLDQGATFNVTVRDKDGNVVKTLTKTFGPTFFTQVGSAGFLDGYALTGGETITFEVTAGAAFLYGATTDNVTNDPSVQLAQEDRIGRQAARRSATAVCHLSGEIASSGASSMCSTRRCAALTATDRGVHQQRAHEENGASRRGQVGRRAAGGDVRQLALGELSGAMAAGDDAQRTVLGAARVEVNADGQHLGQHFRRRLDVQRARLAAPRSIAGNGHPFLDRDGPILMPLRPPVRGGRLVEQRGFDGDQVAADQGPQIAAQPLMLQQALHRGMADQVADAGPASGRFGEGDRQMLALMVGKRDVRQRVAGSVEVVHALSTIPLRVFRQCRAGRARRSCAPRAAPLCGACARALTCSRCRLVTDGRARAMSRLRFPCLLVGGGGRLHAGSASTILDALRRATLFRDRRPRFLTVSRRHVRLRGGTLPRLNYRRSALTPPPSALSPATP